jgi:hypothetical protein
MFFWTWSISSILSPNEVNIAFPLLKNQVQDVTKDHRSQSQRQSRSRRRKGSQKNPLPRIKVAMRKSLTGPNRTDQTHPFESRRAKLQRWSRTETKCEIDSSSISPMNNRTRIAFHFVPLAWECRRNRRHMIPMCGIWQTTSRSHQYTNPAPHMTYLLL